MNIFASIKKYAQKWQEKAVRSFTAEEIEAVSEAYVVESQYGFSVCFLFKTGGQSYIPVDQNSTLNLNDKVDLKTRLLVTLGKSGEDDIYRVR